MKTLICLATAHGLSIISGDGDVWRGETQLRGKDVRCVVAVAETSDVILCGTQGDGLWKSKDSGATWESCKAFQGANISALAAASSASLYAGTEMSAMFQSDNAGESWHELHTLLTLPSARSWSFPPHPETHHVQSILPSLAQPARLHVAIEAGALLRSDDAGRTWEDRVSGSPRDTHSLAAHPSDPGRLHSAAGDGYFESDNDGNTWCRRGDGLKHHYCWSLAISPADPTTLLMSTAADAYAAHFPNQAKSFLYRRTGNEQWQLVRDGLPEPKGTRIPVVAASHFEPATFYVAAEGEVYRSVDGGLRWHKLLVEWNERDGAEHAVGIALVESLI